MDQSIGILESDNEEQIIHPPFRVSNWRRHWAGLVTTKTMTFLQPIVDDYAVSWSPPGQLQALRPPHYVFSTTRLSIDSDPAHATPFNSVNPALLGNFAGDGLTTVRVALRSSIYPLSDEALPLPPPPKHKCQKRSLPPDDGSAAAAGAQKTTRRGHGRSNKQRGKERDAQDFDVEWEGKR